MPSTVEKLTFYVQRQTQLFKICVSIYVSYFMVLLRNFLSLRKCLD